MIMGAIFEEVIFRGLFLLLLFRYHINKPITLAVSISVAFPMIVFHSNEATFSKLNRNTCFSFADISAFFMTL
ncbi:type II CAAX prenyl endopeptidase Rce1 family protein [Alteromonadales bacterium alter-6D02]|uniref:CPBP family glutamic-type intramembrane protease n=1 Tax=Psychrobium sp. 1_MG-2023 TaxID=3062624 RepID=UPI001290D2F4